MDFTFFTTTTMAPAGKLPPAASPSSSGPASLSACRHLPSFSPRFVPAASASSPSPAEPSRATGTIMTEDQEPRAPEKSAGTGPGAGGDAASSSAAEVEDRMDQLWEDFNEELGQLALSRARARRRPRGGSWREPRGDGLLVLEGGRPWSEPSPQSSDAESEPAARAVGCAPVLRPSARAAGGARHCRRRAGTWMLLMRIFRRLFVIEKTISAAAVARQRSSSSTRGR